MRFRVIDIETTGLAPPAEIIEIGCVDVVSEVVDGRQPSGEIAITIELFRRNSFQVAVRRLP